MTPTVARSYRLCEAIARRAAGNFYPAFRLLPQSQRRAMCALYAFSRIADDLSDEPGPLETKRHGLEAWRRGLDGVYLGKCAHPTHAALCEMIEKYDIPHAYLAAIIDGVEMDLAPVSYETFADLRLYCYRVASAVGLACIHIWGFHGEQAKAHAEEAGLAFQLTNILRDLAEDAARGRVYLPREDLERFGYSQAQLLRGECDANFRALMRFEVERARSFYERSWSLLKFLAPPGRAVYFVMARTYRGLLEKIEKRDYDVFNGRVSVSSWRKLLFVAQALPLRWGLALGAFSHF